MWRISFGISSIIFGILFGGESALAWGRRGHSIVCETAAYIASTDPKGGFLKTHSFDLGYYCNVPDLVWKKGDLYKKESFNHFMNLEIFDRAFKDVKDPKDAKIAKPFELNRIEFNEKFPNVTNEAGRLFWRVRELLDGMTKIVATLKQQDLTRENRHAQQADWLLHAGAIGHYLGDLAQPLHVTENYDGQMTNQKGVHEWFETELVDELFLSGGRRSLGEEVIRAAEAKWKKGGNEWAKLATLDLLEELTKRSNRDLKSLLDIDRRLGRKNAEKAAQAFRPMIVDRMAEGAVFLAIIWRRELGWDYNGTKFYNFLSTPAFIETPTDLRPKTAKIESP